ncbi:MAG: hypothetical protein AB1698_09875 [Pseudomonadota bacterium]
MKFGFVDEHRAVWPVRVMCAALGLSATPRTLFGSSGAMIAHSSSLSS